MTGGSAGNHVREKDYESIYTSTIATMLVKLPFKI